MKIVYLDAYTINPVEVHVDALSKLGDFERFDRTSKEQILERAKDADAVFTNKVPLDRETLLQLPKLRYIGVTATGFNIVDIASAKELGITVTNARGYSTNSVAQQVFAMILAFANRLAEHSDNSNWLNSSDFCYYNYPIFDLKGKTLGLIGFGDIGKKVAELALAFDMNVLVYKPNPINPTTGVKPASLEELLQKSDFVSLHCPLTQENQEFINKGSLSLMKENAFLINTARGGLIHEQDLADTLNTGKIGGAYLDVLSEEPPKASNPLLTAKNCKISPHIAWATVEARKRLWDICMDNFESYLAGTPKNVL